MLEAKISPNFEFAITKEHADVGKAGGAKPDIGLYRTKEGEPFVDPHFTMPRKAKADLRRLEIPIELKDSGLSPFVDPPLTATAFPNVEGKVYDLAEEEDDPADSSIAVDYATFDILQPCKASGTRRKARVLGQVISYASLNLSHQHRTFSYAILIVGHNARILRFDRSGSLVTRAMNLLSKKGAKHFCEFIWRFNMASLARRGFDLSHVAATEEEEEAFKRVVKRNIEIQKYNGTQEATEEEIKEYYEPGCVSKSKVYSERDKQMQEHLTSIPVSFPENFHGRSTHPHWSAKEGGEGVWEPGFLKNTWRTEAEGLASEGENYRAIEGTPNVPTVYGHGDVRIPDEHLASAYPGEEECRVCELYGFPRRPSMLLMSV